MTKKDETTKKGGGMTFTFRLPDAVEPYRYAELTGFLDGETFTDAMNQFAEIYAAVYTAFPQTAPQPKTYAPRVQAQTTQAPRTNGHNNGGGYRQNTNGQNTNGGGYRNGQQNGGGYQRPKMDVNKANSSTYVANIPYGEWGGDENKGVRGALARMGWQYWGKNEGGTGMWYGNVFPAPQELGLDISQYIVKGPVTDTDDIGFPDQNV